MKWTFQIISTFFQDAWLFYSMSRRSSIWTAVWGLVGTLTAFFLCWFYVAGMCIFSRR